MLIERFPCADPKSKSGKYWGYSVRLAKNIDGMLHEGPFEGRIQNICR